MTIAVTERPNIRKPHQDGKGLVRKRREKQTRAHIRKRESIQQARTKQVNTRIIDTFETITTAEMTFKTITSIGVIIATIKIIVTTMPRTMTVGGENREQRDKGQE